VLAGVVALSGLASSFGLALGLGSAYVFGMVAPLFAISLLWERFDWRSSRLFRTRSLTWTLGPLRRTITVSALASGVLLALMGGASLYVGLTTDAMPSGTGWQADVSSTLQHYGHVLTDALDWIPGWSAALIVAAAVVLLARRALAELLGADTTEDAGNEPQAGREDAAPVDQGTVTEYV
jgi:cytochrome c-type biogenesis protein